MLPSSLRPASLKRVWQLRLAGLWIGLWLVSGCQVGPTQSISPTPAFLNPGVTLSATLAYAEQISQAKQKWTSSGVTDYRLKLKFYENFANGLETLREVTVKDGQVVESACELNKCPTFVLARVETVDDLFWVAEGGTLPDPSSALAECLHNISFDAAYGFPTFVSIDCPTWADEDNSVQVVSFEVIH